LAVFGGCVALAVALCIVMTPIYASTSSVLVKLGRELVYRPEIGTTNNTTAPPVIDKDEVIASNIAIMTSRDIVERAITTVGIERLYPDLLEPPNPVIAMIKGGLRWVRDTLGFEPGPREALIEQAMRKFLKRLKVEAVKRTSVIEVTFEHPDP